MDLSKLSTEDLIALKNGDLSKVSTEGLMMIRGKPDRTKEENSISRQIGLTGRAAVKGVAGIPAMFADAFGGMANVAQDVVLGKGRGYRFMQQLPQLEALMTRAGVPEPQSRSEKVISDMVSAMAGAGGAAKSSEKVGGALADLMSRNIGTQIVSAATGTGASSGAREIGANEPTQIMAGLLGGMAPTIAQSAVRPARIIGKNLAEPWQKGGAEQIKGRTANLASADRKYRVIESLESPEKFVKGGKPTAGEAAVPAGAPGFAGLQDVLKKRFIKPATEFSAIDDANEASRLAALRGIGKDKSTLDAAVAARKSTAEKTYGRAYGMHVTQDDALAQIAENPYFQDALPTAMKLAKASGVDPDTDVTEFMHFVKIALDKEIAKTGEAALANTERAAAESVKARLVDWLGKRNKAYDVARQTFAAQSKPINQMQVGQFLENKLSAPLAGAERPAMFAQAMRDAPGTIKRATGQPRYDDLSQIMTPQQMGILSNVQSDLARKAKYEQQARTGAEAVRDLLKVETKPIEPSNILHRGVTIARDILERMQGRATRKTLESLAIDMQDPEKMAQLMKNARPQEKIALIEYAKQKSIAGLFGMQQSLPYVQSQP